MKRIAAIVVLLLLALAWGRFHTSEQPPTVASEASIVEERRDSEWRSGQQVQGDGTVIRLLSDDNDGSRHQRFIIRLDSGRTLLVAHNIDLAPRIEALRKGDRVGFFGQYEWNDKGGVIHWTHRDPQGQHVPGWIEHAGRRYQ